MSIGGWIYLWAFYFVCWWTSRLLLCPWNFIGKNTEVGCHVLLKGIFPTQGSNPHLLYLLHWQVDSLPLHHLIIVFLLLPCCDFNIHLCTREWHFHLLNCINAQPNKNAYFKKKPLKYKGCILKIFSPLWNLSKWVVTSLIESLFIPLDIKVLESPVFQIKPFWPNCRDVYSSFQKWSHSQCIYDIWGKYVSMSLVTTIV